MNRKATAARAARRGLFSPGQPPRSASFGLSKTARTPTSAKMLAVTRGERPPEMTRRPPNFRGPDRFDQLARMQVTDRMARTLGLSEEQREQIDAAMERSRVAAQQVMEGVLPRLQGQMDSLRAEIDGILTEDQRAAYREFQRQDRERFRRWTSRRGPPSRRR